MNNPPLYLEFQACLDACCTEHKTLKPKILSAYRCRYGYMLLVSYWKHYLFFFDLDDEGLLRLITGTEMEFSLAMNAQVAAQKVANIIGAASIELR